SNRRVHSPTRLRPGDRTGRRENRPDVSRQYRPATFPIKQLPALARACRDYVLPSCSPEEVSAVEKLSNCFAANKFLAFELACRGSSPTVREGFLMASI